MAELKKQEQFPKNSGPTSKPVSIPGKQENTEVLNGPGHGYGGDHFPAPGPQGCEDGAHHRPRLDLLGSGGEKWTPRKLEVNGAAIVRRQGAVVVIHLVIIIKSYIILLCMRAIHDFIEKVNRVRLPKW